jgi:quinol monooxygenase YgiN
MFALVVRFELRPETVDEFDRLVGQALTGIREERGTLMYLVSRVEDAPLSRVFVEIYTDRAALDAHEQEAHTRAFLGELERLVVSYRIEYLDPVDGKVPAW